MIFSEGTRGDIIICDYWLDTEASPDYQEQPLAQSWARVTKVLEEGGEALSELILWTGQNPRKQHLRPDRPDAVIRELADAAIAAALGIQHITKNALETDKAIEDALRRVVARATSE